MKKKLLLLIWIASLFSGKIFSQSSSLDSIITAEMTSVHSPGLSALILKKGIPVWVHSYGVANIDDNTPVIPSTDFMLASISKTIMSVALMNVEENGGFNLDDNINNYLPFPVINPNYPNDTITFRHLLTHTSSLKDNWNVLGNVYVNGDSPIPLGSFMHDYFVPGNQYYNANQNFYNIHPQTEYHYCNEGAALCGYLVETITGIPFDQYCDDSIFTPLCMNQTSWFLSSLDTTNIARPYSWQQGNYVDQGLYGYPDYPDGQLRTNAISLARFLSMFMNFGEYNGVRILDSSTVAEMRTIQFPSIDNTQGLIWYKWNIGGRSCWGHNGGDAGVSTNMYFSPSDTTGIILLSNGDNFYSNAVMDALFDYAETLEPQAGATFDCNFVFNEVSEIPEQPPVNIFPNPSNGIFQITINNFSGEKTDVSVYNVVGELFWQESFFQNEFVIDLSNQSDGVYFLRINNNGLSMHSTVISQK